MINPFLSNLSILNPLKTPENLRFSNVVKGYKMGTLAKNRLNQKNITSTVLTIGILSDACLTGNTHYETSRFLTQEFAMFLFYF